MKLEQLAKSSGEWLRASGPESDIVVSSRIRLARNLAEFPFISRAAEADRAAIAGAVREHIDSLHAAGKFTSDIVFFDVSELGEVDRQFLVERQLISREHSESDGARAVIVDPTERFSVMVNEEDHLRIQVMHSGLDLEAAWRSGNQLDDLLEEKLTFAYDDRLGYLTACPTNAGTGLRVSVMLHLPALVMTKADPEGLSQALHKDQPGRPRALRRRLARRWGIFIRSPTRSRSARARRT